MAERRKPTWEQYDRRITRDAMLGGALALGDALFTKFYYGTAGGFTHQAAITLNNHPFDFGSLIIAGTVLVAAGGFGGNIIRNLALQSHSSHE